MLVLSEIPPSPSPVRGEVGGGGGVWRILSGECRELRVTKPLMASPRILEGWALGAFTVHIHHRDLSSSSSQTHQTISNHSYQLASYQTRSVWEVQPGPLSQGDNGCVVMLALWCGCIVCYLSCNCGHHLHGGPSPWARDVRPLCSNFSKTNWWQICII